ncbi:MFS transporter [Cytophagaceae bacterium ABcell3]|nr:MFS transporter [Cytophagaceae bacterium ABcell3]
MNQIISAKATKINLFSLKAPHMRVFHLTWLAFFLCFFGWFGIAPLMAIVREELNLTKPEIGNVIICSVAITVFSRLLFGWLCDRIGPRVSYAFLLILGSIPVMSIGLSNSYESFMIFRLAIGVIGAAFVITQYHTTAMFASNVVGTANATTAGWGNLGGGITQMVMPLVFSFFVLIGYADAIAWRLAMVVPGLIMLIMGIVYLRYTKDTPEGNFKDLPENHPLKYRKKEKGESSSFLTAIKDIRVWALFLIYGACFGVELTINNIAAIYFVDNFSLSITSAGLIAGLFGLMNLFARTLGGFFGDRAGKTGGLKGRVLFLGAILFLEGIALVMFASIDILLPAILAMIVFSLFTQMAEGATFSVVPFVNRKAVGTIAGIVGAGGNAGAVLAGFLLKTESMTYQEGLLMLGVIVSVISFSCFLIRFSESDEEAVRIEMKNIAKSLEAQKEQVKPELSKEPAVV